MAAKDFDERTPIPGVLPRLRAVETRADVQEFTISEVGAEVKKLRGEVAEARMAAARDTRELRGHLDDRLDRIERIAQGAARKAEDSSSDLDRFATETRRKLMLKNASLPTAIVLAAFIVGYVVLLATGTPVPAPFVAVAGAVSTAIAGLLPALLGGGAKS